MKSHVGRSVYFRENMALEISEGKSQKVKSSLPSDVKYCWTF